MILAAQGEAFDQENVMDERLHGLDQQMERKGDGSLYFMDRIWVLLVGGVRTVIMEEAHKSRYSVHTGADKMYYATIRRYVLVDGNEAGYCLPNVSECLLSAKGDGPEHQRPSGLLQQPEIPEWNTFLAIREDYSTEKLARLYTDEIVACHEVSVSIISDRDARRKPLEFVVGDRVMLKVSPWKGVVHFGRKGKLAPRLLGIQEIAEFTWEREDYMKFKYPWLFVDRVNESAS
ncbi:hypothetical protein Tco_1067372 [Tanacetum coccineum]|uniref:Reverse transcriptase domain-containing protein n=1 Tax=Tanacetum coccineum TaxID=301880 RepID=A0ABQ5HCN0_9ASTR